MDFEHKAEVGELLAKQDPDMTSTVLESEVAELVLKISAIVFDEAIEAGIRRCFSGHWSTGLLYYRDELRGHYEERL